MVYCFSLMFLRLVPSPPSLPPASSRPLSWALRSSSAMRSARYLDRWSTVALPVVFTNLEEHPLETLYIKEDLLDRKSTM